jgi:alkylated DNA repair protein (DNA oxidative demethylase)
VTGDLFGALPAAGAASETLGDGAIVLRGFAEFEAPALLEAVPEVVAAAPFRRMVTPGGYTMSVAMTNCGAAGWITDRTGYRYDRIDPESGQPWPAMPDCFLELAIAAAAEANPHFVPGACLINRYEPGASVAASGQERARFRESDRVGVLGPAGDLPVRWPEAQRSRPEVRAASR